MDLAQYAQPFIKAADLINGSLRKTIAAVEPPKNYDSPILVFTDGTRLGANKTNLSALIKAVGSTDSAAMVGLEIELFIGPLPDGSGGFKDGLALRVVTKAAAATESTYLKPPMPKPMVKPILKAAPKKLPDGGDYDEPLPSAFSR
jgi:hypothetical protein